MSKLKIAVIGSGISGLSSAWLLSNYAEVHVFEKNEYLGGHTNTVTINTSANENIDVDTGFIVFNRLNYPNFSKFLDYLRIKTYKSDMSFSASIVHKHLEYSGKNLNTIFCQRKNIFNLSFWKMLMDIIRFFNNAKKDLKNFSNYTISDYLSEKKYSEQFINDFLFPMAGSIWSMKLRDIGKYPFSSFVNFFDNHGLLNFFNRPQWETIKGGSKKYIKKIMSEKKIKIILKEEVISIKKNGKNLDVFTTKRKKNFNHVIFANHSNEALKILKDLDLDEKQYLSKIKYQNNIAYLHSDVSLMPKNFKTWSSWNYISSKKDNLCVTYWMNLLQHLETSQNIFVTLNPYKLPKKTTIFRKINYSHPIFDKNAVYAQKFLSNKNNKNIWFCGAYLGYGFHEDGIKSGLEVAEKIIKSKRPW